MKHIIVILKMIFAFIGGLFISDKPSEWQAQDLIRKETELKNKAYLQKFSGKRRYVKCPSV
jgi:uncharacterized protein YneF (UPF0154 family)